MGLYDALTGCHNGDPINLTTAEEWKQALESIRSVCSDSEQKSCNRLLKQIRQAITAIKARQHPICI